MGLQDLDLYKRAKTELSTPVSRLVRSQDLLVKSKREVISIMQSFAKMYKTEKTENPALAKEIVSILKELSERKNKLNKYEKTMGNKFDPGTNNDDLLENKSDNKGGFDLRKFLIENKLTKRRWVISLTQVLIMMIF